MSSTPVPGPTMGTPAVSAQAATAQPLTPAASDFREADKKFEDLQRITRIPGSQARSDALDSFALQHQRTRAEVDVLALKIMDGASLGAKETIRSWGRKS